jgi:hypothetical protein
MKRFKCYIDKEIAELILMMKDDFPNLSSILSKNATLYLDTNKEEVKKIMKNEDNPIFINFKNNPISENLPISFKDNLKKYISNKSKFVDCPNPMVILDIDEENISELRTDFAVPAFTKEMVFKTADTYFIGSYYKRLTKGELIEDNFKTFFNSNPEKPSSNKFNLLHSNSLVITDPYIFSNTKKVDMNTKNVGFENLKLLLEALLPATLKIPFNLAIITDDRECNWSIDIAKLKLNELCNFAKGVREYPIEIEMIVYNLKDKVHGRYGISNNFKMTFDKGLNHFNPSNLNIVNETNDIRIENNFCGVNNIGEIPYETSQHILKDLKQICEDAYSFTKNTAFEATQKFAINSIDTNSIINRLLK